MKSVLTTLIATTCLLLGACGKEAPPKVEPLPVTSVQSQEREIAERLAAQKQEVDTKFRAEMAVAEAERLNGVLRDAVRRWSEARSRTEQVDRTQLAAPLAALEAAKREVEAVEVNECTGKVRAEAVAGMANYQIVLNRFMQKTGSMDAGDQQEAVASIDQVNQAMQKISACRTG